VKEMDFLTKKWEEETIIVPQLHMHAQKQLIRYIVWFKIYSPDVSAYFWSSKGEGGRRGSVYILCFAIGETKVIRTAYWQGILPSVLGQEG